MRPKRRSKQKDILFVLISSFVIVVAWVGFNLYHIYVTSTVSQNIQMQLTPIDPTFNTQTIQALKTRINVAPAFERHATATATAQNASPTPIEPSPTVAASQSATQNTPITIIGQ